MKIPSSSSTNRSHEPNPKRRLVSGSETTKDAAQKVFLASYTPPGRSLVGRVSRGRVKETADLATRHHFKTETPKIYGHHSNRGPKRH